MKMTSPRNNNNNNNNKNGIIFSQMLASQWARGCFVLGAFGLLVFLAGSATLSTTSSSNPSALVGMTDPSDSTVITVTKSAGGTSAGHVVSDTVNGIAYYHCAAHTHPAVRDVVLLHGAAFTKEDWKKSTIFSKLCANGRLSVTALDLSVSADGRQLQSLLHALAIGEGLLDPEGNYVVVTPSASGKAVVDWINTGDLDLLREQVGLWIPIASPAIVKADLEKLHSLRDKKWPILALYGDKDTNGKQVSQHLGTQAAAKVKEFPGPHPFYLGIPDEFTEYLLKELKVDG